MGVAIILVFFDLFSGLRTSPEATRMEPENAGVPKKDSLGSPRGRRIQVNYTPVNEQVAMENWECSSLRPVNLPEGK